jgi:hypothetical protein
LFGEYVKYFLHVALRNRLDRTEHQHCLTFIDFGVPMCRQRMTRRYVALERLCFERAADGAVTVYL